MSETISHLHQPSESPRESPGPLVVAEEVALEDLPGLMRRWAYIGLGQAGLVIEKGQVVKTLKPGRSAVGWSLLGLVSKERSVVRVQASPFTVQIPLKRLFPGQGDPLDATLTAIVRFANPSLAYQALVKDRGGIKAEDLGAILTSSVEQAARAKVADYDGEVLCRDASVQARLATELEPLLRSSLTERGLSLEAVPSLIFRPSEEEDQLFTELQSLRQEALAREKLTAETLDSWTGWLAAKGLASADEIEAAQQAIAKEPTKAAATFSGLLDTSLARLEGQVAARGEALSQKLAKVPSERKVSLQGRAIKYAPLLGAMVAVSAYILWLFITQLDWKHYLGGAAALVTTMSLLADNIRFALFGAVLRAVGFFREALRRRSARGMITASGVGAQVQREGFLSISFFFVSLAGSLASLFWIVARFFLSQTLAIVLAAIGALLGLLLAHNWRQRSLRQRGEAAVTSRALLDRWASRDGLRTDELVRRRIGNELALSVADLKEAKLSAYRRDWAQLSEQLARLESEADMLRSQIERAAFGTRALPRHKKLGQERVARLIAFEENVLSQTEKLSALVRQTKESVAQGNEAPGTAAVAKCLDALRRDFSRRASILEGFMQ